MIAFGALVVATIGAFFVTQHLKVTTPLIQGSPRPDPAVINPLNGTICDGVNNKIMRISFYLQHRSDDVDVYVIDQSGTIVRTIASGRHMRSGVRNPDGEFRWNGLEDNGRIAPDGVYYIEVALIHQGRTVEISDSAGHPEPVTVKTTAPHPAVTRVSPSLIPQDGQPVTIRFTGNEQRLATVEIYRTDLPGRPRLVKQFVTSAGGRAIWDGLINHRPAAAGTYLVGLSVTDAACNTGRFPIGLPPAPGTTPGAGVTVRYLAAEPPLTPVAAGARATVYVDARKHRYHWMLERLGARAPIATGTSASFTLAPKLPGSAAGLYELVLTSGSHTTTVPLLASATRAATHPKMLVVLPALTWQGENPVDDTGDGIPNTLTGGGPVQLARPLANGLPADFADEASLLAYLEKSHQSYDLTTDLGLIEGIGPGMTGHAAVVLAGTERWIPSTLATALRSYVEGGGHVLSLGTGSIQRTVTIAHGQAINPAVPTALDALGARPGPLASQPANSLISVIDDGLGIFNGTSGALQGFTSFQPFSVPAPGRVLSSAGATSTAPSIIGYQLRKGIVVDVGLPGFGSSLAGNVNSQEFLSRVWSVLGRRGP